MRATPLCASTSVTDASSGACGSLLACAFHCSFASLNWGPTQSLSSPWVTMRSGAAEVRLACVALSAIARRPPLICTSSFTDPCVGQAGPFAASAARAADAAEAATAGTSLRASSVLPPVATVVAALASSSPGIVLVWAIASTADAATTAGDAARVRVPGGASSCSAGASTLRCSWSITASASALALPGLMAPSTCAWLPPLCTSAETAHGEPSASTLALPSSASPASRLSASTRSALACTPARPCHVPGALARCSVSAPLSRLGPSRSGPDSASRHHAPGSSCVHCACASPCQTSFLPRFTAPVAASVAAPALRSNCFNCSASARSRASSCSAIGGGATAFFAVDSWGTVPARRPVTWAIQFSKFDAIADEAGLAGAEAAPPPHSDAGAGR